MTRTIFTDEKYELEAGWLPNEGVIIGIRNCNWLQNPTEDLSVTLTSFDVEQLIELLEIYKDAVAEEEASVKALKKLTTN
jgi:hypothetical protein